MQSASQSRVNRYQDAVHDQNDRLEDDDTPNTLIVPIYFVTLLALIAFYFISARNNVWNALEELRHEPAIVLAPITIYLITRSTYYLYNCKPERWRYFLHYYKYNVIGNALFYIAIAAVISLVFLSGLIVEWYGKFLLGFSVIVLVKYHYWRVEKNIAHEAWRRLGRPDAPVRYRVPFMIPNAAYLVGFVCIVESMLQLF